MKRDREETIRSFLEWIKRVHPLPTDHWSETPSPGFFRDPIWSRIFPKYKAESREEAIGRYWDEYYAVAEELAAAHLDRFAIFDTRELNSEEGQERILRFCGLVEGQVLATGLLKNRSSKEPTQYGPASFSSDGLDPKRCVVIVPHGGNIVPACERGLRELELLGYEVRRVGGYAAIDQGRNQMATDALVDGYEETMWIDSDVVFDPASVLELRRHQLPICCGIYSQKGKQALSSHIVPGTERLRFGREGGVAEILYAAAGFLHIRREVYQTVQEKLALPVCNEKFGRPMLPFFAPMIIPANEASWYLAEDFAFCERARQCGYSIFADTRIRLWHVGSYMYGWEDSGGKMPRHDDYTLTFGKASPEKDGVSQHEQGESA
ncbi:hypothetical protein [Rhodopirellula baltica]|nr:hypothetical protein [Rhodopirellula baltica]